VDGSNTGNWLFKTSLFLNNTEIDLITLTTLDDYFEIEGSYTFTEFDFLNGNIAAENTVVTLGDSTTVTASVSKDFTLSTGTDGLTWNSSYANLYQSAEDIFVFEDTLFTFRQH